MISILLAVLLLLAGCTAPHDNPLDPRSDRYVAPGPRPPVPAFTPRVWSEHYFPVGFSSEIYRVLVEFATPDTSFGVDSVWVTYNGLPPRELSGGPWVWGTNYSASYFNCGPFMECAMGQPFRFTARTREGTVHDAGPVYLFRVITGSPQTSEPDSHDVVGPDVVLHWPIFSTTLPHGLRATVTNRDSARVVWISALLPREQLLVNVPQLMDGNYYWTLTAVDSFGNTSRSREAYFTVTSRGPL